MTLDQAALLEMLDALRNANASDRIRPPIVTQDALTTAHGVFGLPANWPNEPSREPSTAGCAARGCGTRCSETRAWQSTATMPKLQLPNRISVR